MKLSDDAASMLLGWADSQRMPLFLAIALACDAEDACHSEVPRTRAEARKYDFALDVYSACNAGLPIGVVTGCVEAVARVLADRGLL